MLLIYLLVNWSFFSHYLLVEDLPDEAPMPRCLLTVYTLYLTVIPYVTLNN